MKFVILIFAVLTGCGFTATSYEIGTTTGRTFEDGAVLQQGVTVWTVNTKIHFDRDKK